MRGNHVLKVVAHGTTPMNYHRVLTHPNSFNDLSLALALIDIILCYLLR